LTTNSTPGTLLAVGHVAFKEEGDLLSIFTKFIRSALNIMISNSNKGDIFVEVNTTNSFGKVPKFIYILVFTVFLAVSKQRLSLLLSIS
jgi:hypothetical protein